MDMDKRPREPHRLSGDTCVLALLAITMQAFAAPCAALVPDEHSWDRMEAALQNLEGDDAEVKRDIAEDGYSIFAILFDPPPGRDSQDVGRVIEDLRYWVRAEKDEWVSTTLLGSLELHDGEELEPLFLDALGSLSPNLRWAGVQWYTDCFNPEAREKLEAIWPSEDRPWVRLDLISALAFQASDRYIDDFLALARSDDAALAGEAIRALSALRDPRAMP